jgi:hypothetical protein
MDHLCNSDRDVDTGNGVRLHHGWVYSHLAGLGCRSCGDTVDQSPSSRLRSLAKSKGAGIPGTRLLGLLSIAVGVSLRALFVR